jgi:hypothetical protein
MNAPTEFDAGDLAQTFLITGKEQLEAGDLDHAEQAYRMAAQHGALAEAEYGLGIVERQRKRWGEAAGHFDKVLQSTQQHERANALYYRAEAAERLGALAQASEGYGRALAFEPRHEQARSARAWLWTHAEFRRQVDTGVPPFDFDDLGVYANLLEDRSLLSTQCVIALRSLRVWAAPPSAVYFGLILPTLAESLKRPHHHPAGAAVVLLAAAAFGTRMLGMANFVLPLLCAFALGSLAWAVVQAVSTTVVIDRGRLIISRGLFARTTSNHELFRVTGLEYKRGWWHRMTGTGYFMMHMQNMPAVIVPGPFPATELGRLYHRLLDLVYLMRANPQIKGIIY